MRWGTTGLWLREKRQALTVRTARNYATCYRRWEQDADLRVPDYCIIVNPLLASSKKVPFFRPPIPGTWKTRSHDAKASCVKSATPKKARIVSKSVPSGDGYDFGISPHPSLVQFDARLNFMLLIRATMQLVALRRNCRTTPAFPAVQWRPKRCPSSDRFHRELSAVLVRWTW